MIAARLAGTIAMTAALCGCGGRERTAIAAPSEVQPIAVEANWRAQVTVADRRRLSEWRTAWISALRQARAGGAGDRIDADASFYAFDAALTDPVPPAGDYRCRTVKLGAKTAGGPGYVAYPFFRCVVSKIGGALTLTKLTGSQRIVGTIYPDDPTRAVFLGTVALGDEQGAMRYGRDNSRDVAGWIERIGPARWRLVQPYPAFESTLDVLELVPA
ncbi:DUF4893 domain-containing protein [Sphingomonas sp. Mn802worker]|uniref:DUF4893 domain-containing protein n=1 Tax=Sphingomonas sp. Mn802worker TaxID=629773 RepID=UPI0003655B76|nr:DUF4893 domain-containing protein [Sphingomonas sp. Mn802worker]